MVYIGVPLLIVATTQKLHEEFGAERAEVLGQV